MNVRNASFGGDGEHHVASAEDEMESVFASLARLLDEGEPVATSSSGVETSPPAKRARPLTLPKLRRRPVRTAPPPQLPPSLRALPRADLMLAGTLRAVLGDTMAPPRRSRRGVLVGAVLVAGASLAAILLPWSTPPLHAETVPALNAAAPAAAPARATPPAAAVSASAKPAAVAPPLTAATAPRSRRLPFPFPSRRAVLAPAAAPASGVKEAPKRDAIGKSANGRLFGTEEG
jgi:hypothetical protein